MTPASIRLAFVAAADATDLDTDGPFLLPACERVGIDAHVCVWDDPSVNWSMFDLVVLRATWDYFRRPDAFLAWMQETAAIVPLYNGPAVVRWNIDKRYLNDLAGAGLPAVPTLFVEPLSPQDVASSLATAESILGEATRVVVKPTISAGSNDTYLFDRSDVEGQLKAANSIAESGRAIMVQPYIDSVDHDAETGLVYFRGVLSHAFRKEPLLTGATEHTGLFLRETISPAVASEEQRLLGDRVIDYVSDRFGALLFGRVDLVEGPDGPLIMEVELIEPGFFHQSDPTSADRFASVLAQLGHALK